MNDTSGPTTTERLFSPGPEGGGTSTPWYRRRAVLLSAGVVVVLVTTVITDLPTHGSRATDVKAESAVISQINDDLAPCLFSVREALTLYSDASGTLSSADRSKIPGLLSDDQTACSYTDDNIFELSDIDIPGSAAGKQVAQAVNTVTVWATSDALGAIQAIQALTSTHANRKARTQLQAEERLLLQDRNKATAEIDAAGRALGTTLPPLNLSKESLPGLAHS